MGLKCGISFHSSSPFSCPVSSLTGCKQTNETPAQMAARQKILLLGNGSEPKGLDPHLATGVPENKVISSLIEGLVAYHPSDDFLDSPGVAEHWEADPNFREWTFHLRKDALWSNGDPVTAEDFVYSYRRMLTPSLGARYADMLYILEGAADYHHGRNTDFSKVGVKAIDTHTLHIRLVGPTPHFTSMLKHYSWFPVNPRVIEAHGGIDNRNASWTQVENFVGNGPFRLKYWRTNNFIEVERSPTYWDRDNVIPNGIRFFPIDRLSTEEAAFRAGQIHYCYQIPLDRIDWYKANEPERIRFDDYLGTYFFRFNVTKPPFDNPLVRKAFTYAIDRESVVTNITRGYERPATGYVYAGMKGYDSPGTLRFDPAYARELLAQAGYPNGEGFPQVEILFNTAESHKIIAEAIQAMWREHLGVNVGLINQEWKVYLDSQYNLRYQISRSGWIGDFMDPITFLLIFTTESGNNNTGWGNSTYDALYEQLLTTGDPDTRYSIMQQMETILLDELPIAPIYWYTRKYLIDPVIKDWHPKLLDNRPFKSIDFHQP
jgi:oligopeptide transport system substrate-binding protein